MRQRRENRGTRQARSGEWRRQRLNVAGEGEMGRHRRREGRREFFLEREEEEGA